MGTAAKKTRGKEREKGPGLTAKQTRTKSPGADIQHPTPHKRHRTRFGATNYPRIARPHNVLQLELELQPQPQPHLRQREQR